MSGFSVVSGLRVSPPESPSRPCVHHLERLALHVVHDVLVSFDPGAVELGSELRGLVFQRLALLHRLPLSDPGLQTPVQHGHGRVPEHPEHPPGARGREGSVLAAVVHDHVRVRAHAQPAGELGEHRGRGQHVVQRRAAVTAPVQVEEGGARDVASPELALGVSPKFGQEPRGVQHAHIGAGSAQRLGEPPDRHQRFGLERHWRAEVRETGTRTETIVGL